MEILITIIQLITTVFMMTFIGFISVLLGLTYWYRNKPKKDTDEEPHKPDGCKYCEHGVALIGNSDSTVYIVDESIVMVSEFECFNCDRIEKESGSIEINYCPMCGRQITNKK